MLTNVQYACMTDRTREDFGMPTRNPPQISIHPAGRSAEHRAAQRKAASR